MLSIAELPESIIKFANVGVSSVPNPTWLAVKLRDALGVLFKLEICAGDKLNELWCWVTLDSAILASAKVPEVILLVGKLGIVPGLFVKFNAALCWTTLDSEILALSNVPEVILLVAKLGISLVVISPLIVADDLFSTLPKPTAPGLLILPTLFNILSIWAGLSFSAAANSFKVSRVAGAASVKLSIAVFTNAVFAICVVFVPAEAVGANGTPVNVGLLNIVDLDSLVTLPKPIPVLKAGVLFVTFTPGNCGVLLKLSLPSDCKVILGLLLIKNWCWVTPGLERVWT